MRFFKLPNADTINLAHVLRFDEDDDGIRLWLSNGLERFITDKRAIGIFLNSIEVVHLD
jgi:hypothetical protein